MLMHPIAFTARRDFIPIPVGTETSRVLYQNFPPSSVFSSPEVGDPTPHVAGDREMRD